MRHVLCPKSPGTVIIARNVVIKCEVPRHKPCLPSVLAAVLVDCPGGMIAMGHMTVDRSNQKSDHTEPLSCRDAPRIVGAPAFRCDLGRPPPSDGDEVCSSSDNDGME